MVLKKKMGEGISARSEMIHHGMNRKGLTKAGAEQREDLKKIPNNLDRVRPGS